MKKRTILTLVVLSTLFVSSVCSAVDKRDPAGNGMQSIAYARDGRLGELVREWSWDTDQEELRYRERTEDGAVTVWEILATGYTDDFEHAALWYDHEDRPVVLYWDGYDFIQLRRSGESWVKEEEWSPPGSVRPAMISYSLDAACVMHVMMLNEKTWPVEEFSLLYGKLSSGGSWETAGEPYTSGTVMSGFDYPGFDNVYLYAYPCNLSLTLDAAGGVHAVFSVDQTEVAVSGGTEVQSSLFYIHRPSGGSWSSRETLLSPGNGSYGDAGLGASIAVAPDGTIAVASTYLPRASTGSPGRCELRYLVKQVDGSWNNSLITNTSDNYTAGDGQRGSGLHPTLIFDAESNPHIAFSDHASQHYSGRGAISYSGQVRYATRNSAIAGSWTISKLISRGSLHPEDFQTFRFAIAARYGQVAVSATSYIWTQGYLPDYQLLTMGELLVPDPDADQDGLLDAWEIRFFGSTNAVPSGHGDGDTQNNGDEYISGTDPTNSNSRFEVSNGWNNSGGFILNWDAVSGRTYTVEWADSLTNSFQTLGTEITHPQNSYTDIVHGAEGEGFYNLKVQLGN